MVELLTRLTDQPQFRRRNYRDRWEGPEPSPSEPETRLKESGSPWSVPPNPKPE